MNFLTERCDLFIDKTKKKSATKEAFSAWGLSFPRKKHVLGVLEGKRFLRYDLQIAGSNVKGVD